LFVPTAGEDSTLLQGPDFYLVANWAAPQLGIDISGKLRYEHIIDVTIAVLPKQILGDNNVSREELFAAVEELLQSSLKLLKCAS